MSVDLAGRDLLRELDFSEPELQSLIDGAAKCKAAKRSGQEPQDLRGRNLVMLFEKTSTRTRCAFEVAAFDRGAHVTYLDPQSSQLGHKESIEDTAAVLSRYYDAIVFRGSSQRAIEQLAAHTAGPVYNALTDDWHPTQMLADFLTMREHSGGKPFAELSYAYLGDARSNMGNSLLVMGAIMGADVRIAAPKALWPNEDVQSAARAAAAFSGARITLTDEPGEAVEGADFVHTDVWVSLGEPASVWDERISLLRPYQVNSQTLAATGNPNVRFMHCLPAFHDMSTSVGRDVAERTGMTEGLEVTDEVFGSSASVVFDQAENRLHTIKALLVATLGA